MKSQHSRSPRDSRDGGSVFLVTNLVNNPEWEENAERACFGHARAWRVGFLLVSLLCLGAVAFVYDLCWQGSSRDLLEALTSEGQRAVSQKWLPSKPEQVLPFKKWMKEWHVKPGKLTPVIYHTYSHHPQFLKDSKEATEFMQWQIAHDCPKQVVGFNLLPNRGEMVVMRVLENVTSPARCQERCTNTPHCSAWTYARYGKFAKHCWRKQVFGTDLHYKKDSAVVSGLPCSPNARGFWWPYQNKDLYDLPITPLDGPELPPLHCQTVLNTASCQSSMDVTSWPMPWPLNTIVHNNPDLKCCAPVEIGQVTESCPPGSTPVRDGEECAGYDAGRFGCCPNTAVSGEQTSTMHCVMLFLPFSYEQDLVALQYEMGAGIFKCDSYALYSSEVVELVPGVVSRRIHNTMMCELGGEFITALNLGIFLCLYRQIMQDMEFKRASWLVKVDPDTVWMPDRLRHVLLEHSWGIGDDGIYLNNCEDGLHGPIEVFSQRAFWKLGAKAKTCSDHLDGQVCTSNCSSVYTQIKQCNGPCTDWWGEDIWSDQCLRRFTKARRVMVKTLLQEAHCKPQIPDWRSCRDQHTIAFHPFKNVWEFKHCAEAMLGGSPPAPTILQDSKHVVP
mmetsp:Transcript_58870/g.137955  ORF Transcript_58870/g.137955 Transcript_58870/m.137955 type:complete len:616 (-) Transcript_58870:200-2047(-)